MAAPPDIALLRAPFYFLRHGESTANRDNVIAGRMDSPLTDLGRRQAVEAADRLEGVALGAVYASTLDRALQTARPFAERRGLTVRTLAGLGERGWGRLEGRPLGERVGGPRAEPPGAEPWNIFVARTWRALAQIDGSAPVVVVAHSGTLRALREGLGLDDGVKAVNAQPMVFTPPESRGDPWSWRAL
ncbi:MAG: histidine phosphatase family protein [Magnetospirillum sp. WYHS-4]